MLMPPSDIAKMHIADLSGMYSYDGQQLDIVELCVVYGSMIDVKFQADVGGRKERLRSNLENSVKEMLALKESGRLEKGKIRNPAYKDQVALFQSEEGMWTAVDLQENQVSEDRNSLDILRLSERVSNFGAETQPLDIAEYNNEINVDFDTVTI